MKSSRLFLPLLLALALLFAQQGGLVHGIAHTLEEQSQDQSLPHDKHCDLCATYAQVGSAIGINHLHFDFASFVGPILNTRFVSCSSTALAAFAARAPPHST
jgi:hypothetical protein